MASTKPVLLLLAVAFSCTLASFIPQDTPVEDADKMLSFPGEEGDEAALYKALNEALLQDPKEAPGDAESAEDVSKVNVNVNNLYTYLYTNVLELEKAQDSDEDAKDSDEEAKDSDEEAKDSDEEAKDSDEEAVGVRGWRCKGGKCRRKCNDKGKNGACVGPICVCWR